MNNGGFVININDKNDSKSNIVYDNVVNNMNNMSMSKDEQIEYLKSRISELEQSQKKKNDFTVLALSMFFSLIIGIVFMVLNFYFFGIIIIFSTCFIGCFHTFKLASNQKVVSSKEFDKIDEIRKFINSKLK